MFSDQGEINFYNDIVSFARIKSRDILAEMTFSPTIEVHAIPTRKYLHDHWVSTIEADLNPVSLYFKVFFSSQAARHFSANNLNIPKEHLPSYMLSSFVEEYLNYLMGGIKSRYRLPTIHPSVPKTEPTFDTVRHSNRSNEMNSEKWMLRDNQSKADLIVQIIVRIRGDLTELHLNEREKYNKVEYL